MTRVRPIVPGVVLIVLAAAVAFGQSPGATDKSEALAEAARKGDAAAVRKLLDEGVDVNTKLREGEKEREEGGGETGSMAIGPHPARARLRAQSSLRRLRKLVCDASHPPRKRGGMTVAMPVFTPPVARLHRLR